MNNQSKSAHDRYLFKPFPCSSHSWVMKELTELPEEAVVLDVGPGSGAIGGYLKNKCGITNLSAVEIDPDTVAELEEQQIYKEITCSVAGLTAKEFDCILLMDLLEHLSDPFSFLTEVAALLKPGGIIYISVPNIAHWSIRFTLLFGFFTYTERGILDKTHLQFFTRKRFTMLLNSVEACSITQMAESLEPVEFVLPEWMTGNSVFKQLRQTQLAIAAVIPGLLAYQHLGVIKKTA